MLFFYSQLNNLLIMIKIYSFFLFLFFAFFLPVQAQNNTSETHLHCGHILDIRSGKILKDMTIVVEGKKIKALKKGYTSDGENIQIINLKDKYILPGLIDFHVHIESETSPTAYTNRFVLNDADVAFISTKYAKRTLLAGFTTVRDLGGTGVNIALRKAIDNGYIEGPRIITAGKAIATTGGHADPSNGFKKSLMGDPGPYEGVANGVDACKKAVRQRYKNGADMIKITATGGVLSLAKNGANPQFSQKELEAIINTAKDYDMHVAAHAHGADGMKRAVLAGVTTIEHGTYMTEEVMTLMKEKGAYYVPTISAGEFVAKQAKIKGYYPDIVVPKALAVGPQIKKTFAKAHKKGVKIAFGTDAGVFPHGENAKEFQYMIESGMTALEALQSATLTNANILKLEIGELKEGFFADIIAVKENPLEQIKTLEDVNFVMKEGNIYKNK